MEEPFPLHSPSWPGGFASRPRNPGFTTARPASHSRTCSSLDSPVIYFPKPPELSQENALAPPTGFERVFGGAADDDAGDDDEASAAADAEEAEGSLRPSFSGAFASVCVNPLPLPPLLIPSSKKRLRPSDELAVEGAVEVPEKVRVADLGFRTLMPVSLRWYVALEEAEAASARFLPAFAQSRVLVGWDAAEALKEV